MKRINSHLQKSQTKQGVASLYVVIFATILFGVITLSFVRIILSEASQSSKDDLSQSAFDAAMAGVEDAKTAISKCLNQNNGDITKCDSLIFNTDCKDNKLQKYLYSDFDAEEVKVQETSSSNGTDQAYTCLIMSRKTADYRTTLNSETRSKVVPIGISSADLADVGSIQINWYSNENGANFDHLRDDSTFANSADAPVPPAISVTLIKTADQINLDNYNNSNGKDYSTMIFLPVKDSVPDDQIRSTLSSTEIENAADSARKHEPYQVKCQRDADFACKVTLQPTLVSGGSAFLVLGLPYGGTDTDFQIVLLDKDGNIKDFDGAQISIDSTGRANQLYRRVETRLDPADGFFPYPEYELTLGDGGGNDAFKKNFWITRKCWTEKGVCDGNRNNGEL